MKRAFPLMLFVLLLGLCPLQLPEFYITLLDYIGLYAIVALGLVLLTGIGGLTSFGQAAFVGIGAYTTAYLTTASELPSWLAPLGGSPWLALLVGLLITATVAFLLGLIMLRLSGHYLPLGTIAWGITLYFLFGNIEQLGGHTGITGIPILVLFGFQLRDGRDFYYLIWGVLLAFIWLTQNLLVSRQGRIIRALKGGSLMVEAMGADTARAKLVIFLIASLFACVSGWLYAHMQRFINPTPFGLQTGIEYLFMVVIGGAGYVWGAVLGAGVITILKQWLQDLLPQLLGTSGNFEVIVFGVMVVLVMQRARQGLWPLIASMRIGPGPGQVLPEAEPLARRPLLTAGSPLLVVKNVRKEFGGVVATNNLSLEMRSGEILALIGPNGAGKSTMFNLISGVLPIKSGEIRFLGERIDRLGISAIARRGVSRSFQHVRLLPAMTVLENVAIGAHWRGCRGVLAALLHLERTEERSIMAEARRQIERVGLGEYMFEPAGSLALGQQRILEVARALCADPYLLLLDEPAAGLRYLEKQALAELLRKLRAEGIGILLVEHDMEFVMGLVDRCLVMDFGIKIAEGFPGDVQKSPAVREAYLGIIE